MLKSSLCDYSDAYILVKRTTIITGGEKLLPPKSPARPPNQILQSRQNDERNKGVIFKNCAPFTDCISEIKYTHIYNTKDIDVVMPFYNLIEYSTNYSKTVRILWKYYRYQSVEKNVAINNSKSFKYKVKKTGKTSACGIEVSLQYLSNFRRTLKLPSINCETNLLLNWSENCVISFARGATKFVITERKRYVPVITLSTNDNTKLFKIMF